MKKIIALILTLVMVVTVLPLAVSADDAAPEVEPLTPIGSNRGDWSVTGNNYKTTSDAPGNNQMLYVLGNAVDGEVTVSATLETGKRMSGFMFGIVNDYFGDTTDPQQISKFDKYYLTMYAETDGTIKIFRVDNNQESTVKTEKVTTSGDTVKLSATYTKNADGVTIELTVDDNTVITYTDDNPFDGVGYGLATRINGATFTDVEHSSGNRPLTAEEIAEITADSNNKLTYAEGSAKASDNLTDPNKKEIPESYSNPDQLFDEKVGEDGKRTRFYTGTPAYSGTAKNEDYGTITWAVEEAAVPTYFILTTGSTTGRGAYIFRLYGSNSENGGWTEIASSYKWMQEKAKVASDVVGIKTSAAEAYKYYKFEFIGTADGDNPRLFEALDFWLYTVPTEGDGENTPPAGGESGETTPPSSEEEDDKTPPKTGDAALLVAAVAAVAVLGTGITVVSKKRVSVK